MTIHAYPFRALLADYGRAVCGLALTVLPLLTEEVVPGLAYALAGLASVFAAFGLRTGLRHAGRLELSATGLRWNGPLAKTIAWNELSSVDLRYFSTRRDRGQGWMQLDLRGSRGTIRLESTLEGFSQVAARCFEVARERQLPLREAALTNLRSLAPEQSINGPRWSTS
ncbi:MAG: hypothetical protein FJX68_04445 [Alphaproteobacteria bacterium]|nr:hypothetical protein [Alphaproteobacteria bacterium]